MEPVHKRRPINTAKRDHYEPNAKASLAIDTVAITTPDEWLFLRQP